MRGDCDLLIFDCDGVLVDSEALAVEAFVTVLRDHGVPVEAEMVERCFGMKQADTLVALAERTGHDIPDTVAAAIWPATRRIFEAGLKPMPGIVAALDRLEGVRHCVASSSNPERIALSLSVTGLAAHFADATFSSHQVARGKPAPDLFLFAAASMKADPARCVVIEDSVFGIAAAQAAGMRSFGFAGGSHIRPGHADVLLAAGAEAVETRWAALAERLAG